MGRRKAAETSQETHQSRKVLSKTRTYKKVCRMKVRQTFFSWIRKREAPGASLWIGFGIVFYSDNLRQSFLPPSAYAAEGKMDTSIKETHKTAKRDLLRLMFFIAFFSSHNNQANFYLFNILHNYCITKFITMFTVPD